MAVPVRPKNRCQRARERAGLSLDQAAKLLGIRRDDLLEFESVDHQYSIIHDDMCRVYQVNKPWLLGDVQIADPETLRQIPGWEVLTKHDFNVIAEFIASLPRK